MTMNENSGSSGTVWAPEDLVLESMRLAERAHRPQRRKAPEGLDELYSGVVPEKIHHRYTAALRRLKDS